MRKIYNSRVFHTLCLMALICVFGGVNEAVAEDNLKKVTYKVTSRTAVELDESATDEPTIFENITATFNNTANNSGIKIYQATKNTSLTFSLSDFGKKIKKIELNACKSSSGAGTADITVGEESFINNYDCTSNFFKGADNCQPLTLTPTDNTKDYSGDISITIKATVNSLYCNAYTIYYESDNGGDNPDPTTPIDATVSITPDPINVEAGQTADVTIKTNYDGTITVTSEDNTIADAIYEDNLIVVEGIAKGATNITISGTGSTTYNDFTKIVAVNVTEKEEPVDPTPDNVLYYENFGDHGTGTKNVDFSVDSEYLTDKTFEVEGSEVKFGPKQNSTYEGASAKGNLYFGTPTATFVIKVGDKLKDYENVQLSFGVFCGWGAGKDATFSIYFSKDGGTTYEAIAMERSQDKSGWYFFDNYSLDGYLENLYIKFANTGNNGNRIDDIKITGTKKTTTEPEAYTLKVGATGYSTLCLDKAYTMPEGLEGAIVTVSDNILAVDYLYTEGEVVAAGMPLLIKADKAGEYTLTYTSEDGTDLKDYTMMSGETDAEGMTVGEAGSKFYKLAAPETGIGFYWGAPDGGAFKNGADKAYLVVPGTVNVQGFRFDGTTTGISGIAGAAGTDAAIYTLDGRRVSSKADELPRGIYIVGGKKVIK